MKTRTLALFIVFCMLLTLFPAVARADDGGASAVPIYASAVDEGGNPIGFTFELSGAVSSDPVALYVYGDGEYELCEDLSGCFLLVCFAEVTVGTGGRIDGSAVFVCGDGGILSNGLVIETEAGVLPAPSESSADSIFQTVSAMMAENPLMLSGEINEIITADSVLIRNDHPLVIKKPASGDPNGLNIVRSLTLEKGASLTGEEGQILEIRKNASVTDLTLYDGDGTTVFSDFSHDETFNYDSESGRWIRCVPEPGPGEPPEPFAENKYEARFSAYGTVKAGETELTSGAQNDFVADAPIAFTLTPNSADAEPFVELEVFDGSAPEDETYIPNTLYDSTLEQDEPEDHRYKLALTEGENGVRSFTFTPTSSTHFEVRVYWSDKDRFDSFICGDGEKFVEYRIKGEGEVSFGDIWLGGWCSYSDEDGFEYFKQGVLKEVTSLSVAITPREGWKLNALGLAGTSLDENAYTISESGAASYVWNELDKGLDVEFAEIGGSGPEEPPVFDYAKAKQQTESRNYAYYGASADDIKAYMAQELWAELFGVLYRWNGEQFEAAHEGEFSGMFGTTDAPAEHGSDDLVCVVSDQLLSAMSFSEQKEASESNILALPYYEYTIQFPDRQTSAAGKVFILEKDKQFVVRIDDAYVLADTDGLDAEQDLVLRAQPDNDGFDVDVFGNGVCVVGGLDAGEGVWAGHVTQEHSGLDIGPINRRLVIVPAGTPVVRIEGETWAAPWGFGSVPLFPVGTQEAPTSAVIYYGNNGESGRRLYIHKAAFEGDTNPIDDADDTGNKVEIDTSRLSSEAATIIETNDGSYTFQFHTSFGVIPLIITFKDGSKGYIDLERTGLDVADCRVGDGKYRVQHGIGSTEYSSNAEHVVTGSFYYATGSETPAESVALLVTVTISDGTTTTEISRMNSAFIETEGEDKWCDDFLLWSGTEAEWSSIISVTAEVAPVSGSGEAAVTELSAEATASSVSFTGAADCVAVSVQLLDGEVILASVTLPVQSGAFSGKFEGLALEAEKIYTLRAASVDGGEWKSVEVEVASAPTPPTPPSPPSSGGSAAVEKYTLTFDSNGGSEVEPVSDAAGTVIDLSEYVPVRDGYTFVGWCGSPSLGDVFTEIELTQDITVYAKWRIACSHGDDCPLAAFSDLDPDAWYHEGIHFCLTRGIMNGIGGGLFDSAGKATRAQIVTMLYRLEGEPEVSGANPFSDVAEGCFYDKSTAWASAEGIVLGYGGGIFAPDDLITREQAATILYRYAEYKGVDTEAMGADTNTLSYTDVFTISEFARPAMHFCIAAGVINGDGNGYLRPSDNASRAEVAAMFQRLCDAIS
ncbi:MAG: S-layer homology domain-containing protein [Oscillospiraceae bacterium]|nr:S-layer homology domain-containing protein [Oscillospiraceae bacterium]